MTIKFLSYIQFEGRHNTSLIMLNRQKMTGNLQQGRAKKRL